jgi:paraquat-inducible protein B
MRFLWHAFFARPDIPLLRLPWNALAVVAAGVAGWWDPAIWAVAGAGEFIYLFTIASNPGFQQYIQERATGELRGDTEEARKRLLSRIGGAARQRYVKLEEKRRRLETLYRETATDDLFADSNTGAMQKLTWLYLNLLVAQRNLVVAPASDARELENQIRNGERELASAPSEAARTSKEATIRLLRERLDNIQHKATSLAEIDADLSRIETQLDYALEEATLRGRPAAISANVELTSRLLGNIEEETTTYSPRLME